LSDDPSFAAFSVAAAHLLALSAVRRNPLTAEHSAQLTEVSMRRETPRDAQVARVIVQLMKASYARDAEEFPRQLIMRFPDAPEFVQGSFLQGALHSEGFLAAWVDAHAEMREPSLRYLKAVAGKLPITILAKFPAEDWRNELKAALAETVEAKTKVRRMVLAGILCFLVLLVAVGYGIMRQM
jgi:hypothetical protein